MVFDEYMVLICPINWLKKMKTIVLTGGPCAGKTTALNHIVEHFSQLGYAVFTLPESPTLFNQAGVDFLTKDKKLFLETEKALLDFQLQMENQFARIAKADGRPALLICDRGTMDIAAYMPQEVWQAILDESKMNPVELRDKRYDAVIHMVTAAKGAEDYYTLANNQSRTETPEIARMLDEKLIHAWEGHPHLRVIGNNTDFTGKLQRVIDEIAAVLGIPEPIETERKFLVEVVGTWPTPSPSLAGGLPSYGTELDIYQTYLQSHDGVEQRLRKRGESGHYIYLLTEKQKLQGAQRIEIEHEIMPSEYIDLLQKADPSRRTIHKLRRCFVWEEQYFELDTFIDPKIQHHILEFESLPGKENCPIQFPPFIKVIEEVTENANYYNANLAKL